MTTASAPSARRGPSPTSADGIRIVMLCTALSVALHALLLTLRLPASSPAAQLLQGSPSRIEGMKGRVVNRPSDTTSFSEFLIANAGSRTPARTEKLGRPAMRADPPASPPSPAPGEESAPHDALPSTVEHSTEGDAGASTGFQTAASLPPGNTSDSYVPRPLLSVPPIAKQAILLAAPPGATTHGRYVGVLSLFIDEQGRVQRINFDEPSLPEAFENAVQKTFMAVQFTPGEIDGVAVKSRLRVEVVFDDTPDLEAKIAR